MPEKTITEKVNQGRQYRALVAMLETRKEDKDGNKDYVVRGYASTFNEPYVLWDGGDWELREQVSPEAFDGADMSDVIFQYDHQGMVFARVSNKSLSLKTDDHGLYVEADLSLTEDSRKLYDAIDKGLVEKMSFGFTVDEDEELRTTENDKVVYLRTIKRIGKLYDVSAVSLPANDGTEISARSLVDGVIAKREAEKTREEAEKAEAAKRAQEEAEAKDKEMRERERLRALALMQI